MKIVFRIVFVIGLLACVKLIPHWFAEGVGADDSGRMLAIGLIALILLLSGVVVFVLLRIKRNEKEL